VAGGGTRAKGQLLPDADVGPRGWSSRDKFAAVLESAVLETAALNGADLAEYCRKRGLYPAQIAAWRSACEQANDWDRLQKHARARRVWVRRPRKRKSGSRIWNASLPARTAHWPKPQRFGFCEKRHQRSGGMRRSPATQDQTVRGTA